MTDSSLRFGNDVDEVMIQAVDRYSQGHLAGGGARVRQIECAGTVRGMEMDETPSIIDRGRGPEIAGTRITVYDVFDEMRAGRQTVEDLARMWSLSVAQVECALQYIEEHREEVVRDFAEIRARHARQRVLSEELIRQRRKARGFQPSDPALWEEFQRRKKAWEERRARNPD